MIRRGFLKMLGAASVAAPVSEMVNKLPPMAGGQRDYPSMGYTKSPTPINILDQSALDLANTLRNQRMVPDCSLTQRIVIEGMKSASPSTKLRMIFEAAQKQETLIKKLYVLAYGEKP